MSIRQLDICNKVMAQAQGIAESDFPIDAFPTKVQSVILGMVRHENFKVEYLATAILSATASALGNTYNIRVKGQWTTNAALYIIMVGRPGLGKTPPLEAVFRPLRKRDCRALEKFKAEMAAYQNTMKESKGNNGTDRPVLRRTIVSDFTPEALMLAHYNCPRGITILADEIMGMFNSANRYNNGQLIEQLLSAWSNSAIDVTRVSNPIPIHIENPCINMVGTTQTRRVHELLKKGYEENAPSRQSNLGGAILCHNALGGPSHDSQLARKKRQILCRAHAYDRWQKKSDLGFHRSVSNRKRGQSQADHA